MLSPQIIILAISMAIASAGGWKITSWYYTSEISEMREDKAKAALEATKRNREIEMLGISLAGAVSERDAYRNQKIDVQFRTVKQKVIEYVKSDAPKCNVSSNWVRIHEIAASGGMSENADTSSSVDDFTGGTTNDSGIPGFGISDDVVLSVVSENYERCERSRSRLIGLQDWAIGLQKIDALTTK